MNLSDTIQPKSDQLNADDLLDRLITIKVTKVSRGDTDQPVTVNFEGDGGRPYKPCKSMRRVLIHAWGDDGSKWAGGRMTLYCDPEVKFGGVKVGGIRISHLSGIDKDLVIPLTVTRAKRQPYTVKPLPAEAKQTPAEDLPYPADLFRERLPKMAEAVREGRMTTDEVIEQCRKTGSLSDDQVREIRALADQSAGQSDEAETESVGGPDEKF